MIIYLKHSVICIFKKNTEEYNVKTSENDVKNSNFNLGEMDKSRELYSKEGDNSNQFEGKTVLWEHTTDVAISSNFIFQFRIPPPPFCICSIELRSFYFAIYFLNVTQNYVKQASHNIHVQHLRENSKSASTKRGNIRIKN